MKYCEKCGKELVNEAVVCPGCGCPVNNVPGFMQQAPIYITPPVQESKAAIVLGILGIVFAWLFALAGHILSIVGIVKGAKEYTNTGKIAGLVLSIIGEVCAVLSSLIGVAMMSGF